MQDRMESETLEFYSNIRNGYRKLAEAEPRRVMILDAESPRDQIHQQIWEKIKPGLNQR